MATGDLGNNGRHAQSHVGKMENSSDPVDVIRLRHSMVAVFAKVHRRMARIALLRSIAQVSAFTYLCSAFQSQLLMLSADC